MVLPYRSSVLQRGVWVLLAFSLILLVVVSAFPKPVLAWTCVDQYACMSDQSCAVGYGWFKREYCSDPNEGYWYTNWEKQFRNCPS